VDGSWPRKRRFKLIGKENAIDILAAGQQFVAFGPHTSGAEYVWPVGSPRDRHYMTLPIVTDAQIDDLSTKLQAVGLLVRDTGKAHERKPIVVAPTGPLLDVHRNPVTAAPARPLRHDIILNFTAGVDDGCLTIDDAEHLLRTMRNDYPIGHPLRLDRDSWRDIAFACHAIIDAEAMARGDTAGVATPQYNADDDRLREAFNQFSDAYSEDPSKKVETADRLWEATRNAREITAGTLVHFARERMPEPVVSDQPVPDSTAPSPALQALLAPTSAADKRAAEELYLSARAVFRQYRSRKIGLVKMFEFLLDAEPAIARLAIHRATMMALAQIPMIESDEACRVAAAAGDRILGENQGNPMVAKAIRGLTRRRGG
jgi:hypothetical protein